jgi:hypothetical protein
MSYQRIPKERQEGRVRISELKVKILEEAESLGCSETEANLAMLEIMSSWANTDFINDYPLEVTE